MKYIKQLIKDYFGSFYANANGMSGRKLTAFLSFTVAVLVTFIWITPETFITVLWSWILTGLLCLGLVTFQQLTEFKNGKTNKEDGNGTKI